MAYGFASARLPRSDEFTDVATDEHGRILVDEGQRTNLPGVFAGGFAVRGPVPMVEL